MGTHVTDNRRVTTCMRVGVAALALIAPAARAEDIAAAAFTGPVASVRFDRGTAGEGGLRLRADIKDSRNGPRDIAGSGGRSGERLYFEVTDPRFKNGGLPLVKLEIEYYDEGGEYATLSYDSSDAWVHPGPNAGAWKSRKILRARNTRAWKTQSVVLPDARFGGRCNGADFRLDGDKICVRAVRLTAAAVPDQERQKQILAGTPPPPPPVPPIKLQLEEVLARAVPYSGKSARAKAPDTLTGKVVCGYQGWFATPTDGSGRGWTHYAEHHTFRPGDCHIEFWPDTSELDPDEKYETPFRRADGSPAHVFSSYNRKTVVRHMAWMAQYGIDGAFVQRFVTGLRGPNVLNKNNTVLMHVREGANLHGRSYAVMYDLSGARDAFDDVTWDWKNLVDRMKVGRDPSDRAYQRHAGRPLVVLWGIFANRAEQLPDIARLMDFFRDDPKYGGMTVMLGTENEWRAGRAPASPDVLKICRKAHIISPWTVGRYGNPEQAKAFIERRNAPDQAWCNAQKIDYMPVIFPGFSWSNMNDGLEPFNAIPRLKGEFFWRQAVLCKAAGAKMLYVAMFDEMDEGTVIMKCDPDPPSGGGTRFLDYEGLPSDHYLWLTGQIGKMLRGEIPAGDRPPRRGR